jgi:23S rRNA (cytidine1920-2'-O)/16S rRNA (cytidine1409-2'-O)-methyltransferase
MSRRRLDAELVHRSLARSREQAKEYVDSGRVKVNGIVATKVATQVEPIASIVVADPGDDYVSRGAYKLIGALDVFGVDPNGCRCLDAGASTGGFTDVLLRRGATTVAAVDVGYGQLAWRLRQDERVSVVERTNVRTLVPEAIGGPVDLVVADLSFISLRLVLPALISCTEPRGRLLLMVKPQFEVGKDSLGPGGVVRDAALRASAVSSIADHAAAAGWGAVDVTASPLPGPAGNVEYFVHLRQGPAAIDDTTIRRAVDEGPQ